MKYEKLDNYDGRKAYDRANPPEKYWEVKMNGVRYLANAGKAYRVIRKIRGLDEVLAEPIKEEKMTRILIQKALMKPYAY